MRVKHHNYTSIRGWGNILETACGRGLISHSRGYWFDFCRFTDSNGLTCLFISILLICTFLFHRLLIHVVFYFFTNLSILGIRLTYSSTWRLLRDPAMMCDVTIVVEMQSVRNCRMSAESTLRCRSEINKRLSAKPLLFLIGHHRSERFTADRLRNDSQSVCFARRPSKSDKAILYNNSIQLVQFGRWIFRTIRRAGDGNGWCRRCGITAAQK